MPLPPTTADSPLVGDSVHRLVLPLRVGKRIRLSASDDGESAIPFECICIDSEEGASVAMVATDQISAEQAEATANLFVASGKLLEALESVLHECAYVRLSKATKANALAAIALASGQNVE